MVAAGGAPPPIMPKAMMTLRSGAETDAEVVKPPSIESISWSSVTNASSGPSTEMPKETDPAGCMVSRLSRMLICDFLSPSTIWVASIRPSVSLEYDLISTVRLANAANAASRICCLLLKRRGAIAASSFRFWAVSCAVSLTNCPVRSLALAADSFAVEASARAFSISTSFALRSRANWSSFALIRRLWAADRFFCCFESTYDVIPYPTAATAVTNTQVNDNAVHHSTDVPKRSTSVVRKWISDTFSPLELVLMSGILMCEVAFLVLLGLQVQRLHNIYCEKRLQNGAKSERRL